MAAKTKPAPKAKIDVTLCRWGEGRYGSPMSARPCKQPRNPKRQLCDPHEQTYRKAKKAANPAPAKAADAKVAPLDPMEREIRAVRTMKARDAEPAQRVAAMVAPEVTVTKTK